MPHDPDPNDCKDDHQAPNPNPTEPPAAMKNAEAPPAPKRGESPHDFIRRRMREIEAQKHQRKDDAK